jgi:hypothetical protein
VWAWSRWLAKRTSVPRFAAVVGYAFAVLSVAPMVLGLAYGIVAVLSVVRPGAGQDPAAPSQKARALGEGISETMNCGALGVLIALVGCGWLLFCTLRWRRRS